MSTIEKAGATVTEGELVIGQSDVISDVPSELVRVMTANSEELEHLPVQLSVNVPGNEG